MKHFFTLCIFFLLGSFISVTAQPTLTASNSQPQNGDLISSQYAHTTSVVPGSSGANQTWDYSALTDSAATEAITFLLPSSTPYFSTFPSANLAGEVVDTGSTSYIYFNATSTGTPILGLQLDTITTKYLHPLSTQEFPFTFPGTFNDSSTIYINSMSGYLKDTLLQLDTVTATGYGTLKLPGGNTYSNVLQVKLSVTAVGRVYVAGLGEITLPPTTEITYSYYAPGYHGALLSYTLSSNGSSITDITYLTDEILPLRFISFTAVSDKQTSVLKWQTGDEQNTGYFNIQHSVDGNNFTNIGEVSAGGSGSNNYNYIDMNPSQGNNFYRIQEVDIDGNFTYSTIASVKINNPEANEFYVINNPVQNFLSVHIGGSSPNSMLMIFDMTGKLVMKISVINSDIQQIDASTLPPGVYTIQYISKTEKVSKKFVKE